MQLQYKGTERMGAQCEGVAFGHIQPNMVAWRCGGQLPAGAEHQCGQSGGCVLVYSAKGGCVSETTVAGISSLVSSNRACSEDI